MDQQREQAEVDALRVEAFAGMAQLRKLRESRLAMSARLRKRLDAILGKFDDSGEPIGDLDGSQSKAIRECVLACERLELVEAGGFRGISKLIDAVESRAVPQTTESDLPSSVPPGVAAGVLALLASCGDH
jgi:hypothetical protein